MATSCISRAAWLLVSVTAALVPAVAGAQAAAPQAVAAKVEGFEVELTGMETLPATAPPAVGVPRVLRERDVVLSLPVAMEAQARLAADVKMPLAGYDWPVAMAQDLSRARRWRGGDLARLDRAAQVYCAPWFSKKGGIAAHLLTLGLSSVGSRFSNWLQICLVDEDRDARFEKAFMVGAKKAPDRVLVPIEPVAYSVTEHAPIPDSRLGVVAFDGGPLVAPNFELHLIVRGARADIGGLFLPGNLPPPEVVKDKQARKAWEKNRPYQLSWTFPIRAAELPQGFVVGDAAFRVNAIDPVARTMTVTLDQPSQGFPFDQIYRQQTIYIYLP